MSASECKIALISDVFFSADGEERLSSRLREAKLERAVLAVLPELALDSWCPATKERRGNDAEEPGGRRYQLLSKAARSVKIGVVGGAIIRDPASGKRYNTVLVFDETGTLIGSYQKLHIPAHEGFWESSHYSAGTKAPRLLEGLGIRFGVQICSDVQRMVSAGNFISVTGGHGDSDASPPDQALPPRSNIADNVDQIGPAVRRDIKYGADWIKLMATGGISDRISDFSTQELSEQQMTAAVEIAHRAHRRVMAHAEGTEGIKAAVRAGVDSIEHGTMLDDEGAALMQKRGTWLVPTLEVIQRYNQPGRKEVDPVVLDKAKAILGFQSASFQVALKHHVKIAFGLDDEPEFLPVEFQALVRGGLTPMEAIQAATINAAELLALSDQVGAIEPGRSADLIGLSTDPVNDIDAMTHVIFVMHNGEIMKNERDSEKPTSQ